MKLKSASLIIAGLIKFLFHEMFLYRVLSLSEKILVLKCNIDEILNFLASHEEIEKFYL
jgi:hypothetical protein